MLIGLLSSFLFASSEPICEKPDTSTYKYSQVVDNENFQIHLYRNKKLTSNPRIIGQHYNFMFKTNEIYSKFKTEELQRFFPKEIELIQKDTKIPGAESLSILFCNKLQTKDKLVLLVDERFIDYPESFHRLLSHELFHFIILRQKLNLPYWLEEGLAVYFQHKMSEQNDFSLFQLHLADSPWLSFSNFNLDFSEKQTHSFYGQVSLYMYYIDHKVSNKLLSFILSQTTNKAWLQIISDFVKPTWPSFHASFIDFQLAKYINMSDSFKMDVSQEERNKYLVLPDFNSLTWNLTNSQPIAFDPGPLSAFIPTNINIYKNSATYEIRWILAEDYEPIRVSKVEIKSPKAFPLVIHLD